MDEDDVPWLAHANQLHDALGVGVRGEGQVLHLQTDVDRRLTVDLDLAAAAGRNVDAWD